MEKNFAPAAPSVRQPGPVDQIVDVMRLARELAERSSYLVGELCGHAPQAAADSALGEKSSNGLIYDLAENASETRQRIIAALDELTRLETTIGS